MTTASSAAVPDPAPPADATPWHTLSPEDALREQGVEVDGT